MPALTSKYGPEVQRVPVDAPLEDIIMLLKRDGGVVVQDFVSHESIDQSYQEILPKMEGDRVWKGTFFPGETKRCPGMIGVSRTYTKDQLMHPLYQAVCNHFLTSVNSFWWGDEWKESVATPQAHSSVAFRIGPGAKAQPLHRDDYLHHNVHDEVPAPWIDERDMNRETAIGLFVAGTDTTRANGATRFIPGSHLWGNNRPTGPNEADCFYAELKKGDAFIMLASCFHGGSANTTTDQHRLVFGTFATRGWLRQEENMYLAVPIDVVKSYDRKTQRFIGYYGAAPGCGLVDLMDPIYQLYPEELATAQPGDF